MLTDTSSSRFDSSPEPVIPTDAELNNMSRAEKSKLVIEYVSRM